MAREITEKYLIQKQVIYALARMSPMAPILHSGKYGHKYDNYTCANCGASVNEIVYHFCPNCGQRLTDASLGKRQTEEERKKYAQMSIFDLFREEIAHDKEQQYWEDTQEALSRIFDRCEEIDPQSGYDMLEDIQFVQGFINKHKPCAESEVQNG